MQENVRMFWIDYEGKHQPYKMLKPGQRHLQQTYLTHPWCFKTARNEDDEDDDEDGEEEEAVEREARTRNKRASTDVDVRLVVNDSPIFYPPLETLDVSDEDGDMAPVPHFALERTTNERVVYSIVEARNCATWTPKTNAMECFQSKAFQAALRETLKVWMRSSEEKSVRAKADDDDKDKDVKETSTTTLNDIPRDVLFEIIARFAPEPPYYNLMFCNI